MPATAALVLWLVSNGAIGGPPAADEAKSTTAPATNATPSDDDTVAEAARDADLAHGRRLFEGQCARCHGMQGAGGTGANLTRPVLRHAANDKQLALIVKEGIPGTAMPGNWFLNDRQIEQVVHYVRSLGRAAEEPLPGDADRGRQLFVAQGCDKCHMVAGQGGGIGPDLSDIGVQRGLDYLRKAVMHPGTNVPENEAGYAAFLVVVTALDDGRVVTGMRINEDTFTIQLRDAKNQIHSLRKSNLIGFRKAGGSMMPSYEQELDTRDVDDLVSYLAELQGHGR